jgi:pantoate--beta-alanine ligase
MGFLHEGHATLVRRARAECDVVVVSIFVNPLQFGAGEDFMSYPRDLERDLALLAAEGTDVVFVPQATEFYPQGADTAVVVGAVAQPLEGAFRPGHFRGVATVVTMLFNAAQATVTYFGEKDWQQLLVVRQLVRDLHMPIDVVGVPTTRESDGLAMSSRNVRLGESDRATALSIPRALEAVRAAYVAGERSVGKLERAMERVLSRATGLRIDYAVIVDAHSLRPAAAPDATLRALIAGRVGGVRLIDNCGLE